MIASGIVFLLGALVSTLSSWSAMRSGEDGGVYVLVNCGLLICGSILLIAGLSKAKSRRAERNR